MKLLMVVILAAGAYYVWQSGLLNKFAGGLHLGGNGGIGGAGGAGGTAFGGMNANGADGEDNNGISMMDGVFASARGSNATVCNNGHCQHFSGDNISVQCVNGVCHSNNARLYEYRL